MLKRIKRRVDRVKDKLNRFTERSERTTLAAQLGAAASHPEPSHAESLAALSTPTVVAPHADTIERNPPLGLVPIASALVLNEVAPDILASTTPGQPDDVLVHAPKATITSTPEPEDTPDQYPNPIASVPVGHGPTGASLGEAPSTPGIPPTQIPAKPVSPVPDSGNTQQQDSTARVPKSPGGEQQSRDTAWSGLKTLAGVLRKSASAFGPLETAVGGLLACVEIFEDEAKARKEYDRLKTELEGLCDDISRFIDVKSPLSTTPSIEILANGIKKELERVNQKGRRNALERYAEARGESDEILECYRRIQMLLSRVALNANMDMWKATSEEVTQNHLKRLPYASAAKYRSAKSDSLGRNGCTPNTRVDVLEQLRRWVEDGDSQRIYWLNGMAGTGKTTIAYTLCERLQDAGELAASFFCSRQMPDCRDTGRILPSIAYQLSLVSRPFRNTVSAVLESRPDVHNEPVDIQFDYLVAKPLREVADTLPTNLVVVIDALDECEDAKSVGKMLFALLKHASDLPVKLFVTSRPDPEILDQMRSELGARVQHELRLHELGRSVVESDIKTYMTTELAGLNVQDAELQTVAERSGVLFIYAATIVRYVKHDNSARSRRRLKQVLAAPTSSNQSHQGVDKLYHTILAAALLDQSLDVLEREEIKKVVHTVVCAQEPLSIDVIARLLGLDMESAVTALRPLLSVLQVESTTGLVTTLHESFRDCMLDPERSKEFHCNAGQHHAWFARACFDQIKAINPPFDICDLQSSYVPDQMVHGLEDKIKSAIPQHLFYACQYWEAHIELAQASNDVMIELFQFLSKRLLLWMEIMNLKRVIRTAIGVLSRLDMWLPRVVSSSATREMALDALKFITSYAYSPTQRLTPHIYLSTLALWPTERAVSRYNSASLSGLTLATGTAVNKRETAMLAKWDASAKVYSVACSPDGAYIATGGEDHAIQIWDARTGETVGLPLQGHTGVVWSVTYSPSGAQIASGSEDCTICIWDAHTRQMIGSPLEGHAGTLYSVAYSPDGMQIASGSGDKTIRIWDALTGCMLGEPITGHTDEVNSVAYSPNGKWIVSGSDDRTVRIWDVQTRQMLESPLGGHTGWVGSVAFSPDGRYIVSGSGDSTIHVWDAHTGQMLGQPITGHTGSVCSVAYSPNGDYIISGSFDETICIWDSHTGTMLGQPLKGHTSYVRSVRYSSDGTRIISSSDDRTIRIWDAHAGQTLGQATEGHRGGVRCVAYSPDSMYVVSGSEDKTLCIWDAHTGQMVGQPLEGHEGAVYSVAYSPDGKHVVSGSGDKTIRIWDANSGKTVGEPLEGHTKTVSSVAYSPDGARIASGSLDKTICIWDAHTWQMMGQPLGGHTGCVYSVAYSPDGMRIVSGSGDKTIRIWDAQTGQILGQPMIGHTEDITSVSYSPDGKHIISGSGDCTVRIWDAQTGEMLGQPLNGHTSWVLSVAYSPDGKYIVSASVDNTIRIWDAHTGETLGQPLEGHTNIVYSVAYSPDGTRIVSGSDDGTIRIWDATTLQQLGDLSQTHQDSNRRDSQGPDSSSLVRSSSSPDIQVYEPKTAEEFPILPSSDPHAWTLSKDGWVVSHDLKPLLRVPPELRDTLLRYGNTCLISKEGSWKLDLSKAKFGKSWRECYCPSDA